MKYLDSNKKIAEFLKLKSFVNPNGTKTYFLWDTLIPYVGLEDYSNDTLIKYTDECHEYELLFHKDWNWLMHVVKIIENLPEGFYVDIRTGATFIKRISDDHTVSHFDIGTGSRFEKAYNAIGYFCERYNYGRAQF